MRIAFIGNFNAPYSTENYHRKTMIEMGHQVIPFQESDAPSVTEILSTEFDLLYWTHTHSWRLGGDAEHLLHKLKERGIPTVGYHLDLWLGLEREKDLKTDPYWGIEHFFTCDRLMADWLNAS